MVIWGYKASLTTLLIGKAPLINEGKKCSYELALSVYRGLFEASFLTLDGYHKWFSLMVTVGL